MKRDGSHSPIVQYIAYNIVKYRHIWLIFFLALTGFFFHHYRQISIEYGAEKMLSDKNPQRVAFEKFLEHFDIEEFFVVTFEADDIFSIPILQNIEFLSSELSRISVDQSGDTFANIKNRKAKKTLNNVVLKLIPDIFHATRESIEHKNTKIDEELDGIWPKKENRKYPVTKVSSVLSATDVQVQGDMIQSGPVSPDGKAPVTASDVEKLRQRVMGNPNFRNNIISKDGKTTAIVVSLRPYLAGDLIKEDMPFEKKKRIQNFVDSYRRELTFYAERILQNQRALDKAQGLNIEYHLAGGPPFSSYYLDYVERDAGLFLPITLILIGLILAGIYRSLRGVVLPLLVVIISVFWTMGAIHFVGSKLTLVSTILYPLILVIGIATVIHIINRYREEVNLILEDNNNEVSKYLNEGKPKLLKADYKQGKLAAIRRTITHIFSPCFWTSTTTSIGFGSLGISEVLPVSETGLFAAWGVMATFTVAIVMTPILLILLPIRKKEKVKGFKNNILSKLLLKLSSFDARYKKGILIASILLTLIAGYFTTWIVAETNLREYFKEDSPIRVAHTFMEDRLSGVTSVEFSIDAKEKDALKNPAILKAIVEFQEYLEGRPAISKTYSFADTIRMMNQVLNEGDKSYYKIPDQKSSVAQYLLLYEQDNSLSSIVDSRNSYTYVSARFHNMGSAKIRKQINEIMEEVPRIFGGLQPPVTVRPIGATYLAVLLEKYIVDGQIESFAIAMIVISIFMFFILRSAGLGAAAILPNILPVILTVGFMGLTGIPINLATCMVPSIAIGIAVDDTIHFLNRYRRERALYQTEAQAVEKVMVTTGQAMVLTSLSLFIGFSVLLFSNFNPNIYFGALTAMTMGTALVGDLILLPAILIYFKISK